MPTQMTDPFADVPSAPVRTPSGRERAEQTSGNLPTLATNTPDGVDVINRTYDVRDYTITRNGHMVRRVQTNCPNGVSQAQFNYAVDLIFDRHTNLPPEEVIASAYLGTKPQVSRLIDNLRAQPKREAVATRTAPSTEQVRRFQVEYATVDTDRGERRIGFATDGETRIPAGCYALDTSNDTGFANDVTFFKLWVGTRHGWKVLMYRSDEEIELQRGHQVSILKRIAADIPGALARYGKHKSKCGICRRKLTNDRSRAAGYGEICASNWGLPY